MNSLTYEVSQVNMSDFIGNAVPHYQFVCPLGTDTVQLVNVLCLEFCICGVNEVLQLLV